MVDDVRVGCEHSVREPVVLMICQIFSTGLSSGDFGGSDTSVMLRGTGSAFETCHPASSRTRMACAPGATAAAIS